jgi:tRNA (mo5U34)-methyltransferase
MDSEALREQAGRIRWYHKLDLGGGVVTDGIHDPEMHWHKLGLGDDLGGRSVLDVGAWDGGYSFKAERCNAGRVLATDHFCWSGPGWGTRDGFELAREARGSAVDALDVDVLDITPEAVGGTFDLVLFLSVLYHMRHPLLALERMAAVTADQIVVATHIDLMTLDRPAMSFWPYREMDADETNWFGPNPPAVIAMLRSAGFDRAGLVWVEGKDANRVMKRYTGRPAPKLPPGMRERWNRPDWDRKREKMRPADPRTAEIGTDVIPYARAVFHAFK